MKRFRKLACLLLALAMMLSLAACGSFEMKMARAAQKMEKLQSYRTDIKVDLGMSMSLLGQSMPLDMTMKGTGDVNTEPERTKMELDMELLGDTVHMLSYSEKDGDSFISYLSQDNGETWVRRSVDRGGLRGLADKKDLGMLLKLAESFEETGTETLRGSEATVYSGVIQGEDIDEAVQLSGVLESLYESMGMDAGASDLDLSGCGSIPTTIAIDNKSGMIVRYTMDLCEVLQNLMPLLMDQAMSAMAAETGLEGLDLGALGLEIKIERAFTTAELYDFDAVGPIEIPDAARAAAELEIAA